VLKEPLGWRYLGAFVCIAGAALFMFAGRAWARTSRRWVGPRGATPAGPGRWCA